MFCLILVHVANIIESLVADWLAKNMTTDMTPYMIVVRC